MWTGYLAYVQGTRVWTPNAYAGQLNLCVLFAAYAKLSQWWTTLWLIRALFDLKMTQLNSKLTQNPQHEEEEHENGIFESKKSFTSILHILRQIQWMTCKRMWRGNKREHYENMQHTNVQKTHEMIFISFFSQRKIWLMRQAANCPATIWQRRKMSITFYFLRAKDEFIKCFVVAECCCEF